VVAKKAVSIAELKEMLAEKEKELANLQARRTTLACELEKVEAQIAELQGKAGGRGRVGLGLTSKAR
jgi:peptidoglycan hydrolase CwlO-like protein